MGKVSEFWALEFNAGTDDVPDMKKVFSQETPWSPKDGKNLAKCELCLFLKVRR